MDAQKTVQKFLQETRATAAPRYKLPYDQQRGEELLTAFYIEQMQWRGVTTPLDTHTRKMISKAVKWLRESSKPGLYLYGGFGCGKSTLADAIRRMIGRLHDSSYKSERKVVLKVTAVELADMRLKPEDGGFEHCKTTKMLYIDDLGAESKMVKSWGTQCKPIPEVLYYRYDHMLFTIVTSNKTLPEIREYDDGRLEDRFFEMFERLEYTNPSYRQ